MNQGNGGPGPVRSCRPNRSPRRLLRSTVRVLVAALLGSALLFGGRRLAFPPARPVAPPLAPDLGWINTDHPLRLDAELKGKVVVVDFWTSGCINCIHSIPDLEFLAHKYSDAPVVILGVHSAKFKGEADAQSIGAAAQKYGITHPIVIDDRFKIWNQYHAQGWPSFAVVGPDGRLVNLAPWWAEPVYLASGDGNRDVLDRGLRRALRIGNANLRTEAPSPPDAAPTLSHPGPFAFPGKVIASAPAPGAPGRVYISDTGHNRIVITTWPDDAGSARLITIIGSGARGLVDGPATVAELNQPQGLALDPIRDILYIADTGNHAIRAVHFNGPESPAQVSTLVGDGSLGDDHAGGRAGRSQKLSSPWDLALSPARDTLYVAMAGTHQVWRIDTVAGTAAAYAGTGIEGLKDGPVSDAEFAQPSGLCFAPIDPAGAPAPTMSFLYVADPESSSIRAINLQTDTVTTIVGHGLADFGDVDQTFPRTRLQHCLGVAAIARPDGGDDLLVADTYNHKIKRLDLRARVSSTLAGSVRNDPADASEGSAPRFNEPGGISVAGTGDAARVFVADTNDHSIILFDPNTQTGRPLRVENLAPRP